MYANLSDKMDDMTKVKPKRLHRHLVAGCNIGPKSCQKNLFLKDGLLFQLVVITLQY